MYKKYKQGIAKIDDTVCLIMLDSVNPLISQSIKKSIGAIAKDKIVIIIPKPHGPELIP
jgi:hypothetical protein